MQGCLSPFRRKSGERRLRSLSRIVFRCQNPVSDVRRHEDERTTGQTPELFVHGRDMRADVRDFGALARSEKHIEHFTRRKSERVGTDQKSEDRRLRFRQRNRCVEIEHVGARYGGVKAAKTVTAGERQFVLTAEIPHSGKYRRGERTFVEDAVKQVGMRETLRRFVQCEDRNSTAERADS